ncbi:MAG TPA: transcription termination/antitermination protein NusA [Firmicutes bacterium]|nr:transcription termination/antitermination protein NusA [Bacillota bacterium]
MNLEVVEAFQQLEREKGIKKDALIAALETALVSAFKRNFGSAHSVRVDVDPDTGEIRVFARRNVVETVRDPRVEISLADALAIDPNYVTGDVVETEVTPRDFGRIAAQTAKQVVMQKIREAERGVIYEEYSNREGDVITGVVQRHEGRNVIIDLGRVEAVMPPSEQIPREAYAQGDRLKVYIMEVRKTPRGPQVLVSRTHPGLLKRLLELEVPEVFDGVVIIRQIAREAGVRSKVAVSTSDENVDPVGACVGPRGLRIQKIVHELKGEKIDVIEWREAPEEFVANALSPARVSGVIIDEETKSARVIVPDNQLSLAIGRAGQNARLAAKLTGWRIDIKSESQALELPSPVEPAAGEATHPVTEEAISPAAGEEEPLEPVMPRDSAVGAGSTELEETVEPVGHEETVEPVKHEEAVEPMEHEEPGEATEARGGDDTVGHPEDAGKPVKPKDKKKGKKRLAGDQDELEVSPGPPKKKAKSRGKIRVDDLVDELADDEEDIF